MNDDKYLIDLCERILGARHHTATASSKLASECLRLLSERDAMQEAVDASKGVMDGYLDLVGHGTWDTVEIEALGWGEDSASIKLIKALRKLEVGNNERA